MLILMRVFAQLDGGANSFMNNHPSGMERYTYLQGEAARCAQIQQQSINSTTSPMPTAAPAYTPEPASTQTGTWKLVQNPNSHWTFKMSDQFLYGEHQYTPERRALGDYDTVDIKKQGDTYLGTQRERSSLRIRDTSPQGFHYKVCQWEFAVQLTSISDDRIEGRWEGYPPGSPVNPLTCERSGTRIWEDVAWIRE